MIKIIKDNKINFRLNPLVRKVVSVNECCLYTDGKVKYLIFALKNNFIEDIQSIEYEIELYDANDLLIKTINGKKDAGIHSKYSRNIIDETPIDVYPDHIVINIVKISFVTSTMINGYFDLGENENINKNKVNKRITEYQIKKSPNTYVDLISLLFFLSFVALAILMFVIQGDFVTIFG